MKINDQHLTAWWLFIDAMLHKRVANSFKNFISFLSLLFSTYSPCIDQAVILTALVSVILFRFCFFFGEFFFCFCYLSTDERSIFWWISKNYIQLTKTNFFLKWFEVREKSLFFAWNVFTAQFPLFDLDFFIRFLPNHQLFFPFNRLLW